MQHFSPDTQCTENLVKKASDFMKLVQNLPVAIYRCTSLPDCQIVFINEGIKDISGYPASHFAEKNKYSFQRFGNHEKNRSQTSCQRQVF